LRDTSIPSRNAALVQRLFDVYNERSFEENFDLIDPDIVWDVSRVQLPDGGSYTGRSEVRGFARAWEEGFESDHVEALEFIEGGDFRSWICRATFRQARNKRAQGTRASTGSASTPLPPGQIATGMTGQEDNRRRRSTCRWDGLVTRARWRR
jgi:ketosteroid isomerase-like protein